MTDTIAPAAEAPRPTETKPVARGMPKWESDARERLRNHIRRTTKQLADLLARDAVEGDTRLYVTDFLAQALGYDKYENLTAEYQVKGEFADYGIRIDKQLAAFVEVKRITTKLSEKHLRQVEMYAVNEGVEWMVLTNGVAWEMYHLDTTTKPATIALVMSVDLLGEDSVSAKANALFPLTLEAMKRDVIDEIWRAKRATSPASLAKVLTSAPVVTAIRRELRRQTGYNVDEKELATLIGSICNAP